MKMPFFSKKLHTTALPLTTAMFLISSLELSYSPKTRQIRKRLEVEKHVTNLELMIGVLIVLTLSTFLQFHEAASRSTITEL